MKTELVKIDVNKVAIVMDYYPRMAWDWTTVQRYVDAMRSGSKFPPIVVVLDGDKYVLIDGAHRLQAMMKIKCETVEAYVCVDLPKRQWLLKAAELNIANPRPLSMQDRAATADKLRRLGFDTESIAKALHMTCVSLNSLLLSRLGPVDAAPVVPLKGSVSRFNGTSNEELARANQGPICHATPLQAVNEVLALLRANAIDLSIPGMADRLREIMKLSKALLAEYRMQKVNAN